MHELRGFMSDDLIEAFKETEAISLGTKCQQYLFSLSLNPPKSAKVSVAEFERVIGEIERRMGLRNTLGDIKEEVLFKTDNGPRAFANGDRILFTRNDKILGVRNGMLGTVTNVGDRQLSPASSPLSSTGTNKVILKICYRGILRLRWERDTAYDICLR